MMSGRSHNSHGKSPQRPDSHEQRKENAASWVASVTSIRFFLIGCILFLATSSLSSESILLRNGKSLDGRITSQTVSHIIVAASTGTRRIPKSQIVRIQYVPFTEAQKKQQKAKYIRQYQAWKKRQDEIRQKKMEEKKKQEELAAIEEKIHQKKLEEAREKADRAEALREMVETGKMEKPDGEPISYWDFAWRSAVLPGWGHFYIDRPVFGTIYSVGTVALLAGVYESRRIALRAVDINETEVQTNFILSVTPNQFSFEQRAFYAYYANGRAFLDYQAKVDRYHYSLYALGLFYGVQLLHIIYNGIAWENGLLIVQDWQDQPRVGEWRSEITLHSNQSLNTQDEIIAQPSDVQVRAGFTHYF